jgi:hypothetical protein
MNEKEIIKKKEDFYKDLEEKFGIEFLYVFENDEKGNKKIGFKKGGEKKE